MKKTIEVEVKVNLAESSKCQTDILALGIFSDDKKLPSEILALDEKLGGALARLMSLGDFKGKSGTSALLYGNEELGAKRVMIVGLGERKKITPEVFRKAASAAAKKAVGLKAQTLALALHKTLGAKLSPKAVAQALAEGVYLGSFRYDEYLTAEKDSRCDALVVEVLLERGAKAKLFKEGLERGIIIGRAQNYARLLANKPGNAINPATLAAEAKKLAAQTPGLSCTVLDEKQLAKLGMGGILAVGSGSQTPPKLIILKYEPSRRAKKLPTIALVGKAITFDSGGISIKPSNGMGEMKLDKSGGLVALATIKAAAELRLGVNILALVPTAENMPSGTSYRPGDIVTTYSGKTVEIDNTDAEGRMILCDALHYAVEQNCGVIIDIATLTGACVVALGKHKAGLMSNDDPLSKQLQAASTASGESVWPLPCGDEYAEEMKSKFADLRNAGERWGGACTAAAFLRQFVGEKKWAHLDIAGVDTLEKSGLSAAEGASGFGVRLLSAYLMTLTGVQK